MSKYRPKGPRHNWTDDQKSTLINLWQHNYTYPEIADRMGQPFNKIKLANCIQRLRLKNPELVPERAR